jgi:hypothetical protein
LQTSAGKFRKGRASAGIFRAIAGKALDSQRSWAVRRGPMQAGPMRLPPIRLCLRKK